MTLKILIALLGLIGTVLLLFLGLAIYSHFKSPSVGLADGRLRPCPASPNCVCSESYPGSQPVHMISPITAHGDIDEFWQLLRDDIAANGGDVVDESSGYLRAEFSSTLFRFVDDLELRLDRRDGVIHIRSASRVGHSDFGANRKRVEAIWSRLEREK